MFDITRTKPDISFIIIEYLSLNDTIKLVESIKKRISGIDYEIIISSNSCYDEHFKIYAEKSIPEARWIFNSINGGFGYGMNQGIKKAIGKYFVFSNPDVILIDGFEKMIRFIDEYEYIGAIGPKIIDKNGVLQDSCRSYVSITHLLMRHFARLFAKKNIVYEKKFNYSLIQTVDWLSGAFIMVKSDVIKKINGFDNGYFLYAEDMDLCTRIRVAGYEIVYFPEATIKFSGSRKARWRLKYALTFIKSHLKYWLKFGFFYGYPRRKMIVFN